MNTFFKTKNIIDKLIPTIFFYKNLKNIFKKFKK